MIKQKKNEKSQRQIYGGFYGSKKQHYYHKIHIHYA